MWQDTFDDASAWSLTYHEGSQEVSQGTVSPDADGNLLLRADFSRADNNRLSRRIYLARPRWISFRLKTDGRMPVERLKLQLCLESPEAPFRFTPKPRRTANGWTEFEADINIPHTLSNVWRFYGVRRLARLTLIIEDPGERSAFDLRLGDLKFRYGDDNVENYRPKGIDLHPTDLPSIAICMNPAGEYYGIEEMLQERFPMVRVSRHACRGPQFPFSNWPPDLSAMSLIVLVDADTCSLSDRDLASLADYVHSGGALLVFAGPNSVVQSLDGRPLAREMLPATITGTALKPVRSTSKLSGILGKGLSFAGTFYEMKPITGAEVLLSDGEGKAMVMSAGFGKGTVALVTCCPDAIQDRGKSIFWSPGYAGALASLVSRIAGIRSVAVPTPRMAKSSLHVEFPYHKRVFSPLGRFAITASGVKDTDLRVVLYDSSNLEVWRTSARPDAEGKALVSGDLPDLADGEYVLRVYAGDDSVSETVAITPPLNVGGFYPIIARVPVTVGGHWLGPKTLRRMVDDVASHGINTIGVPVLDAIAREPQGLHAETAALLELYAQEKGLAVTYDYSHLPTFAHRTRPPFDVRSHDAAQKAKELAEPMTRAADLVPRLVAVKHIDEPTANYANLNMDSDGGKAYREKCGFDVPADEGGEAKLQGIDRLNHWMFVGDYGRRQFKVLYDLYHKENKPWKLLHTFMEPGFGKEAPTTRFEDIFQWGNTADRLDFDIYPYWYPESQKRRFAKVHHGFAFQRGIAQYYGKPMGFYVELDERNWPFQQNPKEATGELAYTAVGEGCHYLNTFNYAIFGAGTGPRPERWEDGGADLRAIAKTAPFLLSTERVKARVAMYFPYRHWIIKGAYYPTFGLELFRRTFGECDMIHEEVALSQGFAPYKAIVLLGTDILPREIESALLEFVKSGGVLILDHCPSQAPNGEPLTALRNAIGAMPADEPWKPETVSIGAGSVIKIPEQLDALYREAVEGDDADTVKMLETWAGNVFADLGIAPSARCPDGDIETDLLAGKNASALVVVNHHPNSAKTEVDIRHLTHGLGYVCDLTTGRAFDFRQEAEHISIPIRLPQRQGTTLGLYPTKPGVPQFEAKVENNEFKITLSEPTAMPLPVFIDALDPAGRKSTRHSRELLLEGHSEIRSKLAINERPGKWTFRMTVPALGTEESKTIEIGER